MLLSSRPSSADNKVNAAATQKTISTNSAKPKLSSGGRPWLGPFGIDGNASIHAATDQPHQTNCSRINRSSIP